MADDVRTAEWDEVGRLFGELGRSIQQAWSASKPEKAVDEAEESAHSVGAAFEELKTSITRTLSDPDVREKAGQATSTLTDVLATNLRQLADWVEHKQTDTADTVADTPEPPPPHATEPPAES